MSDKHSTRKEQERQIRMSSQKKLQKMDDVRKELSERHDCDLLFADGFDHAVVGVAIGFDSPRVAYDAEKMAELLVEGDKMTHEEAWEWLEFNTFGAYVGEETPIYIRGVG